MKAETLKQRVEQLRERFQDMVSGDPLALQIGPHAAIEKLTEALALPDDPRDAKLRAFADSMTPEKWRRLNWQIEEALSEAQLQLSEAELRDDPQAAQMEIDELRERRDSWAEIADSVEALTK